MLIVLHPYFTSFGVVSVLDFGHSNRCVMVSPCCVILHFSDDIFPDVEYLFIFFPFYVSSSREGNGTPLQYSCLENPMDTGARGATVHGVAKSDTT